MDRFGDDLLLSIYDKVNDPGDRKSFSQVSKRFWKLSCLRRQQRLYIVFPDLLYYILPAASPNVGIFKCHKPLSNDHMKLLARSCPQLSLLDIYLDQNFDPSEPNFDDDGLCAVADACMHLSKVFLNRRLHISDVGVAYLIARLNSLISLDLSGCVNVTDESLKAIGESKCLGGLFLAGCSRITDLGLKYLANGNVRKCLAQLTLAECDRISDNGIVILRKMCRLKCLDLSKCGIDVTDRGVQAIISRTPEMYILNLSWLEKVTDVSLFTIARKCRNLGYIGLMGCEGVTGKGLLAFAGHTFLHIIKLSSCHNISTKDVESFIVAKRSYTSIKHWPRSKVYILMPDANDDSDQNNFTEWE